MLRISAGGVLAALIVLTGSFAMADEVKLRALRPIYTDGDGSPIQGPEGIGCVQGTEIIVADTGNRRLLRYALTEDTIEYMGEIAVPQLRRPIHAEVDPQGTIYALDEEEMRIVRLSPQGAFVGYVEPGGASGRIVPRSFKLDEEGNLHLLDVFSERVLVVDSSGATRREIAFPEQYGALADLVVDGRGQVFVIDSVRKEILSAGKGDAVLSLLEQNLKGKAEFPTSIAADDAGNLFVGDQNGGTILVLGRDGSFRARQSGMGWKDGLLRYPSMLCIDEQDLLFVADRANNRIQVFAIVR